MKKDFYEVLGISKGSDAKAIKKAYYKLAKKYHPDTNPNNKQAEQKFKEVSEAYDILSDPEKRKLYDTYGMAAFDGSLNNASGYSSGSGPFREFHYSSGDANINIDDILKSFFGDHGSFKDGFANSGFSGSGFSFNNGGTSQNKRRQRYSGSTYYNNTTAPKPDPSLQDMNANITVSKSEAVSGCDKIITIKRPKTTKFQIHIPAGIREGQKIRLKGKGHQARNGMPDGDLFLKVHIA